MPASSRKPGDRFQILAHPQLCHEVERKKPGHGPDSHALETQRPSLPSVLQLSKNPPHGAERLPLEALRHPPEALLLRYGVVQLTLEAVRKRQGVEQRMSEAVPLTREAVPLLQGAVRELHEAAGHRRGAVQQRLEAEQRPLDGEILAPTLPQTRARQPCA